MIGQRKRLFVFDAALETMGSKPTHAARETGTGFGIANGRTIRPVSSDINTLSDAQSIFEIDTKVAHCTINLRVTEQQLDRTEVSSFSINLSCLCPAERMGAVSSCL